MDDQHFADILRSQYGAALKMLRAAIEKCPEDLWAARSDEAPFWQQALHTIGFTRLYLLPVLLGPESDAHSAAMARLIGEPPPKDSSEPERRRIGMAVWSLTKRDVQPARVPTREELLDRVAAIEAAVERMIADLLRDGPQCASPMPWAGSSRGAVQVYNIRHAQHHIGRLNGLLGRRGIALDWQM